MGPAVRTGRRSGMIRRALGPRGAVSPSGGSSIPAGNRCGVCVGQTLHGGTGTIVIGCSALIRRYRDLIRHHAGQPVMFLHLTGSRHVLAARMAARVGHFMPSSLLDSQLAALEPPEADETAISVDIDQTPQAILAELLHKTGRG